MKVFSTQFSAEKDRGIQQRQIEELNAQLDSETKAKQNMEKLSKQLEGQILEVQSKVEEQERQLADFNTVRNRLNNENQDLMRQIEECNMQVSALCHKRTHNVVIPRSIKCNVSRAL